MTKPIAAEKQNRNPEPKDEKIDELVNRFLKLADPELKDGFSREEPFNGTTLKVKDDGKPSISYEFTETEVAILQTLSEVTGVSLNWLAKDAITWTRGYISGLVQSITGQLGDLIHVKDGACPVPASHRGRTTAFLQAVEAEWNKQSLVERESLIVRNFAS